MNIILATEVIHPGGAETFVLRLASALQDKGHSVHLFIFYRKGFRKPLVQKLAPDVPLHFADIPAEWLLQKADGLFAKLGIDTGLRKRSIEQSLRKLISKTGAEVIHSHLMKSDEVCLAATEDINVPVVTTIHGDYLQFFDKTERGVTIPILNYLVKAKNNLRRLQRVVCISDKQLQFFNHRFATETAGKLEKIYNGYESRSALPQGKRAALGIPAGDFVFGMVSRGIAEKGWERAIQAFQQLQSDRAHLLLVGAGPHLEDLQQKYSADKRIHFTGHSDEPLEWIQAFDAGLLPTTYPSESLPTVVIEYLYCGKPVIASDAGEIRNMIHQNGKEAGIILPLQPDTMVSALKDAMLLYLADKNTYNVHRQNTPIMFEAFRMDACIHRYETAYQSAILNKKNCCMKAYVINMKTSVARRKAIEKQLNDLHMPFEIVDAVDGRKLSEEELAQIVFDVNEFTGSQAGCMMSHINVYKRMQEHDDEFGLIFEDDSLITDPAFSQIIAQAEKLVKEDRSVLLTYYWCREGNMQLKKDKERKIVTNKDNYYFCTPQDVHGVGRSGAYILSKKAAKRIIDFHTPLMQCQADSWVVYYQHGLVNNVDCLYPMPVTENPEFGSEIGYTKNAVELFAKKLAELAVQWNIPIVANAIRQKRINFSKRYKNIVVQ